jgi:methyltransferase (TIGR00027 family)
MWVAAMRGLAELDDPALVHDPFAADLLPLRYASVLRVAQRVPGASRTVLRALALASGNLSRHLAFRTRAIDDAVSGEARTGTEQLVLLGAGFDARAWRLSALECVTVFEVDHPDTQASKRAAIGDRSALAREVRWVPVDFADESRMLLDDALERAGHDASRQTTFVWEGVTMYLTSDAIDSTLAVVSRRAAPGSSLLMTYHDVAFRLELLLLVGMVRAAGEPFRTRMSPVGVRERLARHGFGVERDEGSDDWSSRYLGEPGYRSGERLVVARKKSG